jgi:hypothetical protein
MKISCTRSGGLIPRKLLANEAEITPLSNGGGFAIAQSGSG